MKVREDILARRDHQARNVAKVAAGRKMLEVVFYVLRNQARCLTATPTAAEQAAWSLRLRALGSVRLPWAAATPFVLAALRALRGDPTLARRCPSSRPRARNAQ